MTDQLSAEEVAAVKAENSRRHRAAQTTRNLIWALVATLIVVLFLFLVVVRPAPEASDPIDFATVRTRRVPAGASAASRSAAPDGSCAIA